MVPQATALRASSRRNPFHEFESEYDRRHADTLELDAIIRQHLAYLFNCWADRNDPRYRDPSQPHPRTAVAQALDEIDAATRMLARLRSELETEVKDYDLASDRLRFGRPSPEDCGHVWPGELDQDAVCERGCGLAWVEHATWSQ